MGLCSVARGAFGGLCVAVDEPTSPAVLRGRRTGAMASGRWKGEFEGMFDFSNPVFHVSFIVLWRWRASVAGGWSVQKKNVPRRQRHLSGWSKKTKKLPKEVVTNDCFFCGCTWDLRPCSETPQQHSHSRSLHCQRRTVCTARFPA